MSDIATAFGLAIVRRFENIMKRNKWACIYPGAHKTRWFKTQQAAQNVAKKFNEGEWK